MAFKIRIYNRIPIYRLSWIELKGAQWSFGEEIQTQNVNIYNITQVINQTQKYKSFSITE